MTSLVNTYINNYLYTQRGQNRARLAVRWKNRMVQRGNNRGI